MASYGQSYYADNKPEENARCQQYHRDHKDEINAKQRERMRRHNSENRMLCFSHYGWTCACCGYDDPRFLTLDHIDPAQGHHRKGGTGSLRGVSTIKWAAQWFRRSGAWPEGLQTFCYNCNDAKGSADRCPHQIVVQIAGQLALW